MMDKPNHPENAAITNKAELPEKIAKDKKRIEQDKNRSRRRFFEQQRERQELNELLKDPLDDLDL